MLEGLAAWVLNTYVGEYVENLNTAQLSIALLKGAVELENLPLKKDALKSLDIPIEVKSGFIGKITLHIPFRKINSEPWVISIERLYLVTGPLSDVQHDAETERKRHQEQKKVMLDALEEKWKVTQGNQKDQSSSWFSYGASMAANILENIQLNVKDVHIRYEDGIMNPSCPFACGIIIKYLSAQSTDSTWKPKFVSHNEENKMFKLVDLQDFGIYCDTHVALVGNLPMTELADVLQRNMYLSTNGQFRDHEYILKPIKAEGKVTRNTSALPLRSSATPRIFVELTLGDMSFSLATDQYQSLNLWQKEFARHNRQRKFRKDRPSCSVSSSPKLWWQFALESHLKIIQERNDRLTKSFMTGRAHTVVAYSRIYSAYLKGEVLTAQQKSTKISIEEDLEFEELKEIREATFYKVKKNNQMALMLAKKSPPIEAAPPFQQKESGSLFQHWFPGWSGWSQPADQSTSEMLANVSADVEDKPMTGSEDDLVTEDEIEHKIQDVIKDSSENSSFLRKDAVFAKMTFLLTKGSFQLKESHYPDKDGQTQSSLVELQCSTISMAFESRPRNSAMKFSLAVGSLFVQDLTSKFSAFTHIINPQAKNIGHFTKENEGVEFFKLSYEKNPSSVFKYNVSMKTQPLDIIYLPELIYRIKDLFTSPASGLSRTASSVSSWQFAKLRKQTQEELKNTLDHLMEERATKWNINLDISAPKLIIPENVLDQNPQLVIIDLGNLRVNTVTSQTEQQDLKGKCREDDSEDKFETPLSTPPNETEEDEEVKMTMGTGLLGSVKKSKSSDSLLENCAENMFQEKLYEKYRIGLTEVQVLTGRLKDNWKHAYVRGASLNHVVDRFNISVILERRLITTSDIQWPAAKISGNLPSLTFHLNEKKIQGLQKCLDKFSEPRPVGLSVSSASQSSGIAAMDSMAFPSLPEQYSFDDASPLLSPTHAPNEDNKLVVLQFLINSLSLEVHNQERALVELRVTGVQADVHLKPFNKSLVLTVHSLLLVDALQPYGPDFELLIASHKNVRLDSRSGSIKGSEFNSPSSPLSPMSPASPGSPTQDLTSSHSFSSFQSFQDAISSAFHSVLSQAAPSTQSKKTNEHQSSNLLPPSDAKALIMLEYEVITTSASATQDSESCDTVTRVLNLQFNSLDFIANQETLTEIMAFVNRTFPKSLFANSSQKPALAKNLYPIRQSKTKDIVHVNADFKRLNVMMVKFLSDFGHKVARKVATATLSCAKLEARLDELWEIEGSLGGLHLLDVTPEGTLYQQVVSIGQFQEVDTLTGLPMSPCCTSFAVSTVSSTSEMFKTAADDRIFTDPMFTSAQEKKNACTFVIRTRQQKISQEKDAGLSDMSKPDQEITEAKFDMAALTYVHCPKFLDEMVDCVSEFKDYMTKVYTTIKTAAAEVAMGIVGVRGDKDTTSSDTSSAGYAIRRDHSLGDITNTVLLEDMSFYQGGSVVESNKIVMLINARMESPVLVFPRSPNSPQVLLAHLGEIVVDNSTTDKMSSHSGSSNQDLINLSLTNMNLYSVHLDQQTSLISVGLGSTKLSEITQKFGVPILYDTSVDLTIGKKDLENPFINPDVSSKIDGMFGLGGEYFNEAGTDSESFGQDFSLQVCSLIDIKAKISNHIKLSLSKEVYEQILQTVDNLTYDAEFAKQQTLKHNKNVYFPVNITDQTGPDKLAHKSSNDMPGNDSKSMPNNTDMADLGQGENFLAKHIEFKVPLFEVELRGDFGEGERGIVDLKLYDFAAQYEKNDKACTRVNLHLKALQMDDLLEPPDSKHRQIIVSHPSKSKDRLEKLHSHPKALMSRSCPDSTIVAPIPHMPPSLPASFINSRMNSHYQHLQQSQKSGLSGQRKKAQESPGEYPYTPPPSPVAREPKVIQQRRADELVHIDITLVDKKRPEFHEKYNKTNRFINIDFACLDATINLQTWVVLLDFLGMGAKVHDVSVADEPTKTTLLKNETSKTDSDDVNSEINFQVESFTLIFNKPEYELAQATAADLRTHIEIRDGNLSSNGQLGSLSLLDQSPHGQLYRQRFVSTGRQVVEFNFFKYGLPDPLLQRSFDISLKLRMSSVRYIHTNRFQSELIAFAQNFLQLQDLLGRQRAALVGKKISEIATRGARLLLDIEAVSPILLIPHSSMTNSVLVADLGHLKLKNQFIIDGQPGTLKAKTTSTQTQGSDHYSNCPASALQKGIFHRTMAGSSLNETLPPVKPVDPMTQSIYGSFDGDYRLEGLEMFSAPIRTGSKNFSDLPTGSSCTDKTSSIHTTTSERNINDEDYKCLLDVISVILSDMDLFTAKRIWKSDYSHGDLATDMEFSTFVLQREPGKLLKEKCLLELHIERNLEGDVSHTAPDFDVSGKLSSVYCHLDGSQYELVRGILNHNLGEKIEEFQRPLMSSLQNPSIQTILTGKPWKVINLAIDLRNVTVELLHAHPVSPDVPEKSLARLDFIHSQLSYCSFSNQLKEIDLVSDEIKVYDTRFKAEPVNVRPNVFTSILQPSPGSAENKNFQMKMHLRSSPDSSHYTIILNSVRLMCVFDWLLAMKEYLSKEPPDPFTKVIQTVHSPVTVSEPVLVKSSRNQSPLTVSRGIITKRGPMVEEVKVSFGLVLNFSDTQFVVVEDSTSMDTNAVIFKNTAVITYKPQAQDKILSCSLQSLELFSCCLKDEEDTALSIIDPTSITIDLNANPLPQPNPTATGLLGLKDTQKRQMVLEVVLKTLNIRVSYHDIVMFLAIINSLPQQALQAHQASTNLGSTEAGDKSSTPPLTNAEKMSSPEDNITKSMFGGSTQPYMNINDNIEDKEVVQLIELGYSESEVRKALAHTTWDVDRAALWLTENSNYLYSHKTDASLPSADPGQVLVTAVLLTADCISLQLIDDCGDVDIPLAEIYCNEIDVHQELEPNIEGKAQFKLMAEYYNRKLSGWEPCLEPWKSLIEWKQYDKAADKKLAVQISAQDVLNLNITSTLIDLYKQTSDNWAEDYFSQHRDKSKVFRTVSSSDYVATPRVSFQSQHKRLPFVPYVIWNDTGCVLRFQTATTISSKLMKGPKTSHILESTNIITSNWETVQPGEIKPFHFTRREKLRHQKSHAMHINQLVVTVEGWQRLSPVSVDKVGIYFRHADPELQAPPNVSPARIVFDVQQEGSARKLIIVRSALVVHNKLDSPVELKMESTDESGHFVSMTVTENTAVPIPLYCINMRIRARPTDWSVNFCKKPLDWQHVKKPGDIPDGIRTCEFLGPKRGEYRFFVSVTRQKYPPEEHLMLGSASQPFSHGYIHPTLPGHILTLLPPLSICNLLPLELHYYFKGLEVSGNLKAGKTAALHGVDVSQAMELGIHLEYFPKCKELTIPPNTTTGKALLRLFDSEERMLKLNVRIKLVKGGSIMLTISAQYWLVNKTGLPLVFRQDCSSTIAAGQFKEHEEARNVMPFLFSFVEKEELNLCQMRVGTSYHGPNSKPQWCHRFSLEGGTFKRALHVVHREGNKPDWVYNIGVQITSGGPRYKGTTVVTFAPQFFLDNQSNFTLAIAQQFITKKENSEQTYLTAIQKCSLPFHWPRVDLDQLLCVKLLDITGCRWSGGFHIDKINSFHINMRDTQGQCHLLKVEVVQEGPTFFIVFADADIMPPPFRIDNLCDIPVMYYQTNTTDDRLKSLIKPKTSIPYAWDEPTLRPLQLTLGIMGGTSASYSLDRLEEGEQLHYENFIYLAATSTFNRNWPKESAELVLDCGHSNNIVFRKKENSKRSQLWRMTGSGMLEHEGSTAPRDPRNPNSNSVPSLVLDISDIAPRLDKPVPLVLKKPDARRKTTQTWRFTSEGHLMCLVANMCVQAIGGDKGLQDGAVAIFGPVPDQRSFSPAPSVFNHTLISRQKLRPGSGCVSVRVSVDGPIRVIELVDIQQRAWLKEYTEAARLSILLVQKQVIKRMTMEKELEEWEVYDEVKGKQETKSDSNGRSKVIELMVNLKNGIGVSLVNSSAEELMYISLKNITLEILSQPMSTTFDISVGHIQADNQMWGAQRPVVLYVTPLSRSDVPDNTPAVHISAYKVPSGKWKAQIFKHLYVSTKRMTLHIEELLLYKLLQLAGLGKDNKSLNQMDENETYRALSAATAIQSTRYYFGHIKVNFNRVTLSMLTASKLNPDLKAIKHLLGTRLIAFEQANIEMRSFEKFYLFETKNFLVNEIKNHFKEELIGQAAKILGSVDFLGNPLGLFNDITEGISGLVKDGNVTGLVKNVTHGFSNSTAKVVSSISDGISIVTFDEEHNQRREALKNVTSGSSSDHVMAGFKGLGHGIMGGMTSLISQTISGAQSEGLGGLIKGVGKGVIGTVTKPVSGVLDLTSGFANALRDTSLRTSQRCPGRIRPSRCTLGPGGLLPLYNKHQSESQNTLYELNGNDYSEYLIAMEILTSGKTGEGNMFVLISSRQVIFLNQKGHFKPDVILQICYADILHCSYIFADNKYYVELTRKTNSDAAATSLNKPRVRCDKETTAKKVAQEIKYAKNLYDERAQTLEIDGSSDEED